MMKEKKTTASLDGTEQLLWYLFVSLTALVALYNLYQQNWRVLVTSLVTLSMYVFYAMFSRQKTLRFPLAVRGLFICLSLLALYFSYTERQWDVVGNAVVAIVLFSLPIILRGKKMFLLPPMFQIIIFFYIFASMFLGEIYHYYYRYQWWDVVTHLSSAPFLGYAGFLLVFALNKDRNIHVKLSPFFLAMFAFCFSVMIGVTWEIFEYLSDEFLHANMQKARGLEQVYGLFDTRLGVLDTMEDLLVNSIGAFIVSFIGYHYLKKGNRDISSFWRGKDQFLEDNPDLFQ